MRSLAVADSRKPREERRYEPARSTPPVPSNNEMKLTRTGAARSEVDSSDEAQPVLLEV